MEFATFGGKKKSKHQTPYIGNVWSLMLISIKPHTNFDGKKLRKFSGDELFLETEILSQNALLVSFRETKKNFIFGPQIFKKHATSNSIH